LLFIDTPQVKFFWLLCNIEAAKARLMPSIGYEKL
jgi:hypothetical protein